MAEPTGEPSSILPLRWIAQEHNIANRTITDPRWRRRAGLRVVRLGGKILGVRRDDYEAALRRGF